MKIPLIRGLVSVNCRDCRLLTSIPQHSTKHSYGVKSLQGLSVHGCYWSSLCGQKSKSEMDNQINKLTRLQRWFKSLILSKKLTRLIPRIIPLYYDPESKGGFFEKKKMLTFLESI